MRQQEFFAVWKTCLSFQYYLKFSDRSILGIVRSDDQQRAIPGILHHVLDNFCERYASIAIWQRGAEDHKIEFAFPHFLDDLGLRLSDPYLTLGRHSEPFQAVF